MEQRGITREYVRQALEGPYISKKPEGPGKTKISARCRSKTLFVVFNKNPTRYFVITTYWDD